MLVGAEKNFRFGVRFLPAVKPVSVESREIFDGLIQKEEMLSVPPKIWCILEISPAKLSFTGIACEKQVTETNKAEINKHKRFISSGQARGANLQIINSKGRDYSIYRVLLYQISAFFKSIH
jgi:hypothetical protein